MVRFVLGLVWLALGAIVAVWFFEGLLGTDQRESMIAFLGDRETGMIFAGVLWGLSSIPFGMALNTGGRAKP